MSTAVIFSSNLLFENVLISFSLIQIIDFYRHSDSVVISSYSTVPRKRHLLSRFCIFASSNFRPCLLHLKSSSKSPLYGKTWLLIMGCYWTTNYWLLKNKTWRITKSVLPLLWYYPMKNRWSSVTHFHTLKLDCIFLNPGVSSRVYYLCINNLNITHNAILISNT